MLTENNNWSKQITQNTFEFQIQGCGTQKRTKLCIDLLRFLEESSFNFLRIDEEQEEAEMATEWGRGLLA